MKKLSLIALALLMSVASAMAGDIKVVAHRGYWKTAGSAQNSIRALVKADSIGCYGSEFDVWLTADNKLVVNHDNSIGGFVIETSKASDVLRQKLSNGENVPTLDAYLAAAKKLKTRLVFELKPHKDKAHELKAVKMVLARVKKFGLEDRVDYITFSRNAFVAFCRQVPKGTPVYYLNGDLSPEDIKKLGGAGADYHIDVFRKQHPDWIKKLHDLGLKVNIWTVNKPADLQWCIDNGADFITTNEPELLQKMLKK